MPPSLRIEQPPGQRPILSADIPSTTEWRRALEEIYHGRNIFSFTSGQGIPLQEQELWVVGRGIVQLNTLHPCGDEVLVGIALPSMPFGLHFTSLDPYLAIALTDVALIRFTIAEVEQSPQLTASIYRHLKRRLQQTETLLSLVSNRRVEERLKQMLLLLQREIGHPVPGGVKIALRLTHQHLANAISSTRVTVTRALGLLQEEGWLWIDRDRHIIVAEPAVASDASPRSTPGG
jgi:CRP-like cAMP-binding protein